MREQNLGIILMPIKETEKKGLENKSIYVLYKNEETRKIEIGILNPYIKEKQPGIANLYRLKDAKEKAYFYNGGQELFKYAELTNRPIYQIHSRDNRTLAEDYSIINETESNSITIEDLLKNSDKILEKQEKRIDFSVEVSLKESDKETTKVYKK